MRKTFVWALMAILAVAGSAFAAPGGIVANATFLSGSPATTNNDDSCDISVAPAATLLLPYFEVDTANPAGETTLFTITNVSQVPQIAHVTIWTDRSFPVLDFNIFLTGYDVQSINLYDIIQRGRIAEPGTSSDSDVGDRSLDNDQNPVITAAGLLPCENLAVQIPSALLTDLKNSLTTGRYGTCTQAGNAHTNAIGYVTVDVSRACSTFLPYDSTYYTSTTGIAFDNTLIGDYQQVNSSQNFAQGNPMVHIRAIPEGGTSGSLPTNFDRTFYGRYQDGATLDRRQPLPSTFAARWISGGSTSFETSYKIWREGVTGDSLEEACSAYVNNNLLAITELVRFDEEENPTTFSPDVVISPAPTGAVTLPETSLTNVANTIYPPNSEGAVAGWMYLNLDHGSPEDGPDPIASQNWVIVSMRADGRYSVDYDAAWLGNGCSPFAPITDEDGGAPAIGPAGDINP